MIAGRDRESAPSSVPKVDDPGKPESLTDDAIDSEKVQKVTTRKQEPQRKRTEEVLHIEESVVHIDVLSAILELRVRDPEVLFPDPVCHFLAAVDQETHWHCVSLVSLCTQMRRSERMSG